MRLRIIAKHVGLFYGKMQIWSFEPLVTAWKSLALTFDVYLL